jgi:hypothetical protein
VKPIASLVLLVTALTFCGLGCNTAKVTAARDFAAPSSSKPTVVYVADFELWAQNIKHEDGVLSGRQGPVGRVGQRLSGNSSDPAARAKQLVDLMASSLLKDLSKAGFHAVYLPSNVAVPTEGWLIRGVFSDVQEGNRLRRATIGFGAGQTDLQVIVNVQDLSKGAPKPLYEITTDATSGQKPGAAPTIAFGPYGMAARFVMAKGDLDKNVKHTAAKITEQMAARIQHGTASDPRSI